MLVSVVSKDGITAILETDDLEELRLNKGVTWHSNSRTTFVRSVNTTLSNWLCRGIPPGENRVLNMEKSTIVHDEPERSAVEELREAVREIGLHPEANWVSVPRKVVEKIVSALARFESQKVTTSPACADDFSEDA